MNRWIQDSLHCSYPSTIRDGEATVYQNYQDHNQTETEFEVNIESVDSSRQKNLTLMWVLKLICQRYADLDLQPSEDVQHPRM